MWKKTFVLSHGGCVTQVDHKPEKLLEIYKKIQNLTAYKNALYVAVLGCLLGRKKETEGENVGLQITGLHEKLLVEDPTERAF